MFSRVAAFGIGWKIDSRSSGATWKDLVDLLNVRLIPGTEEANVARGSGAPGVQEFPDGLAIRGYQWRHQLIRRIFVGFRCSEHLFGISRRVDQVGRQLRWT